MIEEREEKLFDPMSAFVTGAVLGAVLALLIGPRRRPSFKKEFGRAAERTRKDFRKSGKRLRGTTGDVLEDGASVLKDIRKELERFVEDARESLRDVVNDEMQSIEKGLNKRKNRIFG
jgi:gas vesicle protein